MTWQYTPYTLAYGICAIISVIVALMALRRRAVPGGFELCLLMVATAMFSLGTALEESFVEIQARVFWTTVFYVGTVSSPVFFLLFALKYTRQDLWLSRHGAILIWILPAITVVMAATNPFHHWLWSSHTFSADDPRVLLYGHGPYFWVSVAYSYLLVFAGILALTHAVIRSPNLYHRQGALLIGASLIPFIGSIIYVSGLTPIAGMDVTPFSFSLTGIILVFIILKYHMMDIVPIARNTLIENMGDGVLVLDEKDRIVDINPVACEQLKVDSKTSIGLPVESVLASWREIRMKLGEQQGLLTEIHLRQTPPLYLDLRITPLLDRRKRFMGRLLIFRDSTERHQAEVELARNVEELRIVNRISLAITEGLDLDNILRTLYEQCSQVAPMDIFYVALCEPSSSLVNIPLYVDDGKHTVGASRDIRDHPGVIGNVIQARRTLYLQDNVKRATRPLMQIKSEIDKPTKSYIGIPLSVRDSVIGVMSVQSRQRNAYTAEQVRLLEQIAIQAAIAIENACLYAEEQRLAIIDELTGVYNYRGLIELGTREVERARRFSHPLSILFFDVDDFHNFNNTYNHATGNLVLRAVARRCCSVFRSVDIMARFGGDEFVALLPETDLVSAKVVARRLGEEIAALKVDTSFGNLGVTISIGAAALVAETKDLAGLIDHACQAERQAKQTQKGVFAFSPSSASTKKNPG